MRSGSIDNATSTAIRDVALRLFADRGFEATSMRDIAREVGVTPGAIYHYIGTKEDLLVAIMQQGAHTLLADAKLALETAGNSPVDRLSTLAQIHVRVHAERQLEALVVDNEIRALTKANRRRNVQLRDEYEELWTEVIRDGTKAGLFIVDDERMFRLGAIQMCTGVANWYSADGATPLNEIAGNFARMVLRMAGVKQPQGRRRRRVGAAVPGGGSAVSSR